MLLGSKVITLWCFLKAESWRNHEVRPFAPPSWYQDEGLSLPMNLVVHVDVTDFDCRHGSLPPIDSSGYRREPFPPQTPFHQETWLTVLGLAMVDQA